MCHENIDCRKCCPYYSLWILVNISNNQPNPDHRKSIQLCIVYTIHWQQCLGVFLSGTWNNWFVLVPFDFDLGCICNIELNQVDPSIVRWCNSYMIVAAHSIVLDLQDTPNMHSTRLKVGIVRGNTVNKMLGFFLPGKTQKDTPRISSGLTLVGTSQLHMIHT